MGYARTTHGLRTRLRICPYTDHGDSVRPAPVERESSDGLEALGSGLVERALQPRRTPRGPARNTRLEGYRDRGYTGALIGFLVRLFLAAVTLAGQLAGFQMGLAIANVIDPATSDRYTIIAQLLNLIAMFVFVEMDGHLMAVRVLATSFEWLPPFSAALGGEVFHDMVFSGGKEMFRLALQIGWPISLALLLVYLSMALLSRVAPQINMLMVGFPITISVGLIVIMIGIPTLTLEMERMFQDAFFAVERLLAALRV